MTVIAIALSVTAIARSGNARNSTCGNCDPGGYPPYACNLFANAYKTVYWNGYEWGCVSSGNNWYWLLIG